MSDDRVLGDESYDSEDDDDYVASDGDESEVDSVPDEESLPEPGNEVQDDSVVQSKEQLWTAFLSDAANPAPSDKNVDQAGKEAPISEACGADGKRNSPNSRRDRSAQSFLTYEFAGEEVKVLKSNINEQPAHSNDANIDTEKLEDPLQQQTPSSSSQTAVSDVAVSNSKQAVKRPGGGLTGVLSLLDKKQKLSTLQKSQLDWAGFKKAENLNEQLEQHNRGKHGFIERQEFLQRADYRQFENERDVRQANRKSLNN